MKQKKLYKHYLPEVLSFDEFKSVKSVDEAMVFHMVDGKTSKTIDIVEDIKLYSLMKYFSYYTHKARSKVKLIVIDMYSPYISLIKAMFPNDEIIIDNFHLTQLISTALNKTRIAFGFRSFRRFKARIMICKNLLCIKKLVLKLH